MERASVIKKFSSEFDTIQQNILLSQFTYDNDLVLNKLADNINSKISTENLIDIELTACKNSSSTLHAQKIESIIYISSSITSTKEFSFYGPANYGEVPSDPALSSIVLTQIKQKLEELLLLSYRNNIDFDRLAHHIYSKLLTSAVFTVDLHTVAPDRGITRSDMTFYGNELTVKRIEEAIGDHNYVETGNTWYLPDGQQVPKNAKKYTISYSDKIDTKQSTAMYEEGDEHAAENKRRILSAITSANPIGFKEIITANASEDDVFSTIFDFFRASDAFQSTENGTANLMNEFNWHKAASTEIVTDNNNIRLLDKIDTLQILDSAHSTDSGVFTVFKFPTTKGKLFIESADTERYKIINNGILQFIGNGNVNEIRITTDILAQLFSNVVGDSSTNKMEIFLSRIIGPSGTTVISYQQIYHLLYSIAKLLENVKVFSFSVYMKRNDTYPYKSTRFLATLYPEIPFNNNDTDSYYQAVLDSPTFQQTGINCKSLKAYSEIDYKNSSIDQSSLYANFFELLYSSKVHYGEGRLENPYSINSKKLIYTTIESHRESPTFDVFDKNGSNGQPMYFANYRTSTYRLTDCIDDVVSMFGLEKNAIISKKSVLQAFYFLLSKWHENIRQLHCDVFCCHANCHTVKYYPAAGSSAAPTDQAITKDIKIYYSFYGWNKETNVQGEGYATNPQSFKAGIVSQMVLPNDETITTWTSSREKNSNDYVSDRDQLKLRLKFPEYHGSAAGIKVYAEYLINDFFSINESNYSARGDGDPINFGVKVKTPCAILGHDVQHFPTDNYNIICEDRVDATGEITEPTENFIPADYYTAASITRTVSTNLTFDEIPSNAMISCIPTEINVVYKATLDTTPPSYGKYPLEKAIFTLLSPGTDHGYVFPDTSNFSSPRVYTGEGVYVDSVKQDDDYQYLGPFVQLRKPGIEYFATEFCPSLNLYSCQIPTGESVNPSFVNFADYFAGQYPVDQYPDLEGADMHTMISQECTILYSNRNGLGGNTGTITLVAKNGAKVFNGSTTLDYTVDIMQPLSLTNSALATICFNPSDLNENGEAITLAPRVILGETYLTDTREIQDQLLDVNYLPITRSADGRQIITVSVSPQAASSGELYYSSEKQLTCYLYQTPDDLNYDSGLIEVPAAAGDKLTTTWSWNISDNEGADDVVDSLGTASVYQRIPVDNIATDQPLRIKVVTKVSKEENDKPFLQYNLPASAAGTIYLQAKVVKTTGETLNINFGAAGYAVYGHHQVTVAIPDVGPKKVPSNADRAYLPQTNTFYTEIPAADLENLSEVQVTVTGTICDPNRKRSRDLAMTLYYNADVVSTVTFDRSPGSGGTESQSVKYGLIPDDIAIPHRDSYAFTGYFTDDAVATKYVDESGKWIRMWDKFTSETLYAKWDAIYTIALNRNGGSDGPATTTARKGQRVQKIASVPTRTGYTFTGYYASSSGTGTQYIKADGNSSNSTWGTASGGTIYARWTVKKSKIIFDKAGGTSGTSSKSNVQFGTEMSSISITKPRLTGYSFAGYFDSAGKQYFASTGTGLAGITWDKEDAEVTLKAQWTPA